MGFLLFILALTLGIILIPIAILYTIIRCLWGHQIGVALKSIDYKFHVLAASFDQYGNVALKELLNDTCTKNSTNPFGNIRQTISMVLGHNLLAGTLSKTGKLVVFIVGKAHCTKWALLDPTTKN